MGQLRVNRRRHTRKSHVKDVKPGTGVVKKRIKKTTVKRSVFLIKDRGAKGRTPESERFFDPQVHTGAKFADGMLAGKRRRLVLRAHKNDALSAGRAMIALSNVQHRINPEVSRLAKSDANYFFRLNEKRKKE